MRTPCRLNPQLHRGERVDDGRMDKAVSRRGMRIGELAALLGTTTKTLRFYEQIGLLGPARRSESAYRLYDDDAVANARLVIGLRHLELTIPELQALLRDDGRSTRRQRLLALMDERLRRMELELSVLQGRCDDLAARHSALLATPRMRTPNCICDALLQTCTCPASR
jgi:DNA-binding transcriptional MerR regulator